MKSFATFLLAVLILISLPTQARANEGLKQAFDELNYSLSVEWDQDDEEFYNDAVERFQSSIRTLQENGLTNDEIIEFSVKQVRNKKFGEELRLAFNLIDAKKLDKTQSEDLMLEVLNKSYKRGASWEVYWGGIMTYGIVAVGILLLAAAMSSTNNNQPAN